MAIVLDLNQPSAAIGDAHRNARGSSIEAVLGQLFHHRRRALDDLACGDLVGHNLGEDVDLGGKRS